MPDLKLEDVINRLSERMEKAWPDCIGVQKVHLTRLISEIRKRDEVLWKARAMLRDLVEPQDYDEYEKILDKTLRGEK